MTYRNKAAFAMGAGLLLTGLTIGARADAPGRHPHYLHALSDLRDARAFLTHGDEQNVENDEGGAIIEIDQALGAIRRAAIDDGKNLNDHPPVDATLSHRDRLSRAVALIGEANHDLSINEDDKAALGWRRDAQLHVRNAYSDARRALQTDYHDDHPFKRGSHPHFLHAISDLRGARALLNLRDEGNVVADERQTISAINDAIRFAKQGAVDDGLNIFFNPPAARNLPRHNRLLQARKLIGDAHAEMTRFHETDPQADRPLYQSVSAVDRAWKAINQAIADDRSDDNPANL